MKKFIISLFVISYSLLAMPKIVLAEAQCVQGAGAKGILSLDPSIGTLNKGCLYPIKVIVDTGGACSDGTDAIIFYDASRFSITSTDITSNAATYADFPGNNVDESSGKITISGLASVTTPFTGRGTLATLNFKVKDNAATGATIIKFDFDAYKKDLTTDSNIVERNTIADVLNSVVNGNYIIGTGACVGVATPSPTPKSGIGGPGGYATPSASVSPTPKPTQGTIDEAVGGKTGTLELTSTLVILGGVLTVLGILGLALL